MELRYLGQGLQRFYRVRPETEGDVSAIREVNRLAFGRQNESGLIEAIRASEFFVPELSLVALSDEVIGHILFSILSIETENGTVPTLGLAPMAVKPEYQNQGVGTTLVREGLEKCAELGFGHVVVLGHPNFYPKFGFVTAKSKEIQPPFPVRDDVFMVYEIQTGSLEGIRGKVKYPPAFDAV
jgi:putative acetyltransferase